MTYATETKVRNYTGFTTTNASSLTTAIINDLITDSDRETEMLTGRKWGSGNTVTEYLDGPRQDMFENRAINISLTNWPVQSITEFLELNLDGSTAHTYTVPLTITNNYGIDTSGEYEVDGSIGKITLVGGKSVPEGPKRIKVSYTYGYATTPSEITEISSILAAIRAISFVTGGIYDGIKNYSVPEMSVGKEQGERLQRVADQLRERAMQLINSPTVGRRELTIVGATAGTRWGTVTQLTS